MSFCYRLMKRTPNNKSIILIFYKSFGSLLSYLSFLFVVMWERNVKRIRMKNPVGGERQMKTVK